MITRLLLTSAFVLAMNEVAAAQTPDHHAIALQALAQRDSIEAVVLRSGHDQLRPEDVKQWIGQRTAYDAVLAMLRHEPDNSEAWSNALLALATIASGDSHLAGLTLTQLETFVVNDRRFASNDSALGTPTEHKKFLEAAILAKLAAPVACGILAKYSPDVSSQAIQLLTKWSDLDYWHHQIIEWPAYKYSSLAERDLNLALISVRTLRDKICSKDAANAITNVQKQILLEKDPVTRKNEYPNSHWVFVETNKQSLECN